MLPDVRTRLPGPKAWKYLRMAEKYEARSMSDQVPIVWKRAKGVMVEDVDGNRFLDFTSGVLVANIGHSHPGLVKEIRDQADKVVNCYDFANEYRSGLAKKLINLTPSNLDKAFILTTGAEATESAMKLARLYTGKYEIIAFHGGFHGRTFGALSVGGKRSGASTKGFGPFLPGVVLVPFSFCYRCAFGKSYPGCDYQCLRYLDWVYETSTEKKVAAVITEAYQGGAGSIIPPGDYMKRLERWCRERDILLIFDEVQSSFGRTGKMFCFQHYGIKPNLLCLGKGISSSVPLSALLGESRIMDVLTPGTMSSTHGGNAFCARIALKNIEIIEKEGLVENSRVQGRYILGRFKKMEKKYKILGEARGMGLVLGLEIVKDKRSREPAPRTAGKMVEKCYRKGLLMIAPIGFYGNVIRVAPPLVIDREQAKKGCDIIEKVLREIS